MIKRIAAIVLAGTVSGSLLLTGSASAARATPTVTIAHLPGLVLIDDRPVTITSTFISDALNVTLVIRRGEASKPSQVFHHGQRWTFKTTFLPTDSLGEWDVTATPVDAETSGTSVSRRLLLQHRTRIVDFQARPRLILAGHSSTVSGRLQVQIHHRWVALAGKTIVIVANSGGNAPPPRTPVTTDEYGRFSLAVTPAKDTRYHAEFSDNLMENQAATTKAILVIVIKPHSGGHRR